MNRYDKLFRLYVSELTESKNAAEKWWKSLLITEAARLENAKSAEIAILERWPFGPTSHPLVIATYRKYYLLCHALNKQMENTGLEDGPTVTEEHWGEESELEENTPVPPGAFVLDWLAGPETNDLYDFMVSMVFVPIGRKYGEPV